MSSASSSGNRRYKSGSVKRSEDAKRKLEAVASDPKQRRLSFSPPVRPLALASSPTHLATPANTNTEFESQCDVDVDVASQSQEAEEPVQPETDAFQQSTSIPESESEAVVNSSTVNSPTPISSSSDRIFSRSECGSGADENEEDDDGRDSSCSGAPAASQPRQTSSDTLDLDIVHFIAPAENAPLSVKKAFMENHPIQPTPDYDGKNIFDPSRVCFLTDKFNNNNKDPPPRNWLSLHKSTKKLYCSVCMAFSPRKEKETNNFVDGYLFNKKTIYQNIERHELSKIHVTACDVDVDVASQSQEAEEPVQPETDVFQQSTSIPESESEAVVNSSTVNSPTPISSSSDRIFSRSECGSGADENEEDDDGRDSSCSGAPAAIQPRQTSSDTLDLDIVHFIAPAENAPLSVKKAFMENHPIQPTPDYDGKNIFDPSRVCFLTDKFNNNNKDPPPRNWLSLHKSTKKLYCSVCMAFSPRKEKETNNFVDGYLFNKKTIYQNIERHELSKIHVTAVNAYIHAISNKDIDTLINVDLVNQRASEKTFRRDVVQRLIDICLFIGRQGIAFRGSDESAANLENRATNHGNFLELLLLLSEYDVVLQKHIKLCIEFAKKRKESSKGQKGRGSFITFFSKNSINKLIKIIGDEVQGLVLHKVKEAGIFSLQMDSTQDVGVLDQLCFTVRYVNRNGPVERLLRLRVSHDNSGEALFNLVKEEFAKLGLDIKNCVGCSFDGASNMSGIYKGLQARLKTVNPEMQFTHCAAHCLNLVLSDCCKNISNCKGFFGLIQTGTTFLSDSYKRMEVWSAAVQQSGKMHTKLRRLQKIGATRWWSKPKALKSILDESQNKAGEQNNFIDFLSVMNTIKDSDSFDDKSHFEAKCIIDSWKKFENILTAIIWNDIFKESTLVSDALQSKDVDYLVTFQLAKSLLRGMQSKRDLFDSYVERAKSYASMINDFLEEENIDIVIHTDFKPIRAAKNTTVSGRSTRRSGLGSGPGQRQSAETPEEELARELEEAKLNYKVNTFLVIIDQLVVGLSERFTPNEELLKDCATLDPKRFGQLREVDQTLLNTVAARAKVDAEQARKELHAFSKAYADIVNTNLSYDGSSVSSQAQDSSEDDELDIEIDENSNE
ncbi:hypothetical protein FOCC_FOCC017199, partial [Frankliniella occidentalis]